ncbi:MAG: hypothetical protein MUE69_33620 [Myxococcota bacterium]|nr:hypothetical protein [Myxococcota bacterium]
MVLAYLLMALPMWSVTAYADPTCPNLDTVEGLADEQARYVSVGGFNAPLIRRRREAGPMTESQCGAIGEHLDDPNRESCSLYGCDALFHEAAPDESVVREIATMRDFHAAVVADDYQWMVDDGLLIGVWVDEDDPRQVYVNFAGSTPTPEDWNMDVNSLVENLWDEASLSSAYPRLIQRALRHLFTDSTSPIAVGTAEAPIFVTLSGHSQGGNVAQLVDAALESDVTASERQRFTSGGIPQEPTGDGNERSFRWLHGELARRHVQLRGTVAVASRPMLYHRDRNESFRGVARRAVFVNAAQDYVPRLGAHATWWRRRPDIGNPLRSESGTFLRTLSDVGQNLTRVLGLGVNSPRSNRLEVETCLSEPLAETRFGNLDCERINVVRETSQVWFYNTRDEGAVATHGNAYIAPEVVAPRPSESRRWSRFLLGDDLLAVDVSRLPDSESELTVDVLANDLEVGEGRQPADTELRNVQVLRSSPALESARVVDGRLVLRLRSRADLERNVLQRGLAGVGRFTRTQPRLHDIQLTYTLASAPQRRGFVRVDLYDGSDSDRYPFGDETTSPFQGGPFFAAAADRAVDIAPVQAPIRAYLPGLHPVAQRGRDWVTRPLRLRYLGGYGPDCLGPADFRDEPMGSPVVKRRRSITDPFGTEVTVCNADGSGAYDAQAARDAVQPQICRDGLPDQTWVSPNPARIQSSVRTGDEDRLLAQQLVQWRLTDGTPERNPMDLRDPGEQPLLNRAHWLCQECPEDHPWSEEQEQCECPLGCDGEPLTWDGSECVGEVECPPPTPTCVEPECCLGPECAPCASGEVRDEDGECKGCRDVCPLEWTCRIQATWPHIPGAEGLVDECVVGLRGNAAPQVSTGPDGSQSLASEVCGVETGSGNCRSWGDRVEILSCTSRRMYHCPSGCC